MKHVGSEWAQSFDLGAAGRGLHYAIAPLVLILIGREKRETFRDWSPGLFYLAKTKERFV